MRLRYIELFHAILTTGSLTGAAKLLNISQPAASKALQHAEENLGFPLFSRVRGRLQPTEQTRLLRGRIEGVVAQMHELQRLADGMSQPGSLPLRVTCTPTPSIALLADAAALLRRASPGTVIELATHHSLSLCESLTLRETDLGITLQDITRENLRQEVLCPAQLVVIAPPGRWSARELAKPLSIDALANQPMVGITVRDALGSLVQGHLGQIEPPPRTSVWVQTYQLARALVARGEGLAVVDPFTARRGGLEPVQVRALEPEVEIALYALYRADSPLNPVQKQFLGTVRDLAQRVLAEG